MNMIGRPPPALAATEVALPAVPEMAPPTATPGRSRRDHRVDALRGVALTMMFCDHIPQNVLNRLTIRNLGFCDAAEIFVLLAGFASMLAYGRAFARQGVGSGIRRLGARIVKLWLFQMAMMVTFIVVIRWWRQHLHPVPVDFLEPELAYGTHGLWRVLFLDALPGNLNILPLYMALLIAFPLIYWGLTRAKWLALAASAALWGAINLDPALNVPNWFDPDGWYFDPFAWQFLFTLGAWAAMDTARSGGDVPQRRPIVLLCWGYLLFSAVQSFPWAQWHLPVLAPFHIPPPQKTPLSPLRLLDVMAIFYLVQGSRLARTVAESRVGQVLAVYGRHSLEVFSLGTVFDLFGRLVMLTWGDGWLMQVGVNVVGLGALYAVARALDARKNRARQAAASRAAARTGSGAASGTAGTAAA